MRKTTFLLSLMGMLLAPALASAQAVVELRLGLPVVLPQLVVVSPGIQVVPDVDEEVFFTSGFYWVRRGPVWYRSHNHRGGWVVVPGGAVPPGLARMPPGHYRRWHPARPAPVGYRGGGPVFRGGGGGNAVFRGGGGDWKHGGGGDGGWKRDGGDRHGGDGGGKHGGGDGGGKRFKGHDRHD